MPRLDLSKDMNIEVIAHLIEKGSDKPLHGGAFKVRLYDRDFFEDDFLGESGLDHDGRVVVIFNPSQINRNALLHEDSLDIYFAVFHHDKLIFKSKVMPDLAPAEEFKMGEGEQIDLGTFLIDTGR